MVYLSDKYANTDETIVSKRLFDECKVIYRQLDINNQNIITINLKNN